VNQGGHDRDHRQYRVQDLPHFASTTNAAAATAPNQTREGVSAGVNAVTLLKSADSAT
jgi:hypothetical protein